MQIPEILGRQALEALQASRRDLLVILDRDFRILYANEAAAASGGYRPEDIVGRAMADFLPPATFDKATAGYRAVLEDGQERIFEESWELQGVGSLWLERQLSPLRDEAGAVTGVLALSRDVTSRRRAEEALQQAHDALEAAVETRTAELRALLDEAPDAILVADGEGRIVLASRHASEVFGYPAGALVGMSIEDLVPEGARDAHRAHREGFGARPRRRLMGGDEVGLQARRADGTVFDADISLSPLQTPAGLRVMAVVRDVTERRRLLARAEQTRRLESVGRLAGGVAHDFNNMMTLIVGYAEMLLEQTGARDARRKPLESILAAAERAARVTGQLFAFSRRLVLSPEVVEAEPLLAGLVEARRARAGELRVEARWRAPGSLVHVDPAALRDAVDALVDNAAEALAAAGRPGRVTLETSVVPAGDGAPSGSAAGWLRLRVADDGPGMDPATRDRALEPFFTTRGTGMAGGLGLPTVHGIVTQSGGTLDLESEPGGGTRVTVHLPLHAEGPAA